MATLSKICLDADIDIRELATFLIPDLDPDNTTTCLCNPREGSITYWFKRGRTEIFLEENSHTFEFTNETARYRYVFGLMYGERTENLKFLYWYLQQHGCFPLALRKNEDFTDETFEPSGPPPLSSVVTRLMPVEIILHTAKRYDYVRRELTKYTGLDFSLERDIVSDTPPGIIWYFRSFSKWEYGNARYPDTGSNYYIIRVFGTDDNPVRRRLVRDAFARVLFAKIEASVSYPVEIYDVIAGEFQSFPKEFVAGESV